MAQLSLMESVTDMLNKLKIKGSVALRALPGGTFAFGDPVAPVPLSRCALRPSPAHTTAVHYNVIASTARWSAMTMTCDSPFRPLPLRTDEIVQICACSPGGDFEELCSGRDGDRAWCTLAGFQVATARPRRLLCDVPTLSQSPPHLPACRTACV